MNRPAFQFSPHSKNYIILFFICLLSYGLGLNNNFIIDDHLFLNGEYDRVFRTPLDYFSLTKSQHYQPFYYLINHNLFRSLNELPQALRAINVLLLFGACASLYALLLSLTQRKNLAMLTAALFAVHPLTANSVNQITHNVVLLCLICVLQSISFYLKFTQSKRPVHIAISLILFAVALGTVEAAALTILYLLATLMIFKKKRFFPTLRDLWPFFALLAAFLVIWANVALKNLFAANISQHTGVSLPVYLSSYGRLLFWYVQNLLYPNAIVLSYNLLIPVPMAWAAFPLGLLAAFVFLWKRFSPRNEIRLALVWVAAGFVYVLPGILTHPYMGIVLSPHWLLIPSVGIFLLIAAWLTHERKEGEPTRWRAVLALVLIVYFASFTLSLQEKAQTQKSFCAHWASICPDNSIALFCLGKISSDEGRTSEALSIYKRLLEIDRYRSGLAYANIASLYFDLGHLATAKEMAHLALADQQPGTYKAKAHNTLGIIHSSNGNNLGAEDQFKLAYALDPTNFLVILNLSDIYFLKNDHEKGRTFLEETLREQLPQDQRHVIMARLAATYFKQENAQKGSFYIEEIIREDPSFEAFTRIAAILKSFGFDNLSRLMIEAGLKTYPEKAQQQFLAPPSLPQPLP